MPETVGFPWFEHDLTPPETAAYTHFLSLLAEMAKRQARLGLMGEVSSPLSKMRLARLWILGMGMAEAKEFIDKYLPGAQA